MKNDEFSLRHLIKELVGGVDVTRLLHAINLLLLCEDGPGLLSLNSVLVHQDHDGHDGNGHHEKEDSSTKHRQDYHQGHISCWSNIWCCGWLGLVDSEDSHVRLSYCARRSWVRIVGQLVTKGRNIVIGCGWLAGVSDWVSCNMVRQHVNTKHTQW